MGGEGVKRRVGQSALDKLSRRRHDRNMEQARIAQEIDRGNPGDAGRAEAAKRFKQQIAETDFSAGSSMAAFASGSTLEALKTPAPSTLPPVDAAIAQAEAAMERGDFDAAGRLFDKAARLEAAEKAKEAATRAQSDKIIGLIEQGWDPAEAEAEVTGNSPEGIRRRDFIAKARKDGHAGKGFDELLASVHAQYVAEQYYRSEQETRGALKSAYVGKYHPRDLWKVNDATARKIMTPEMAGWFDRNGGRITRDVMKRAILSGSDVFNDTKGREDYLR